MQRVLAACGGFLLAVLWFDLMFDVQVLWHGVGALPEDVLASIAGYYRRVTTEAFPMNRLIAAVMLVTVGGAAYAWARGAGPRWRARAALLSAALPVGLAALRVVPNAVRLGTRADSLDIQSQLARCVCYDHLICFAAIGVFLALQLTGRSGDDRTTAIRL